jgi:hypothetical protein
MLSHIRVLVAARQRAAQCRRQGHAWTAMAYPPACVTCGRTRFGPIDDAVTEHAAAA